MSRPLVFAVLLAFFADFSSCRRIKRTGVAPGTDGLTSTHGFHSAAGLAHLHFGSNVGVHGDPAAAPALVVYDYRDVDQVPGTVSSGTQKGNVLELHTALPSDGTTSASVSSRRTFDFGPTHSFFGSELGTSQRSSLSAHSQVFTRQQLPETSTITHGRGGTSRLTQATTVAEGVNGGDSTSPFAPVAPFDDHVATAFALKGSATGVTKASPFTPGLTGSAAGPGGEREPSSVQVPVATDIGLRQGLAEDTTPTPFSERTDDPKRVTAASADNQTPSFSKPSTDAEAVHSTPGLTQSTAGFSDDPAHHNISTPATADSNLKQGHGETLAHVSGPVRDSTVSVGTNDSSVRNVSAGHAAQGFTTSATKEESSDRLASTSPSTTTSEKLEKSPTFVSSTPSKGTHQPSTATPGTTATVKPAPDSSAVFEPLNKVAVETTSTVSHTFQQTLPPARVPSTAQPRPPTAKPMIDAYVRPITEHSVDQFVPHRHRDEIEAYGHEDDHVRGSRCGRCQRKLHTCVEKCFLHHSCEAEANSELSCPRINAPCFPPFKYEVDQCKHSGDCEGTNHLCCLVGCSRKCVVGVRANHWAHP